MRKPIPESDPIAEEFIKQSAARSLDGSVDGRSKSCLRQLAAGIGFTSERPITDVGIPAFYEALSHLGFDLASQHIAAYSGDDFVDQMVMRARTSGRIAHLYNRVSDSDADDPFAQ